MKAPTEFIEVFDETTFNPLELYKETPFTQAFFYGEWQENIGRRVRRFVAKDADEMIACFQVITYPLIRGKNYLYIPYGPVIKEGMDESFFINLKTFLQKKVQEENAVFVRLDFSPTISKGSEAEKHIQKIFRRTPLYATHSAYFQPRDEWFLDLHETEENLLKSMHPKTRYSIKLAEKKGVTVEIIEKNLSAYFEIFYALLHETATRNKFHLHSKEYYKHIFENCDKNNNAFLAIARYNNKIVAADLVVIYGTIAHFVFGGSSNEDRNVAPSALLQWKAIVRAKKLGCESYSFGAISPEKGTHTQWDGLSTFKIKFGGRRVIHSDFYDLIVQPLWYHLYNFRKLLKKFI